jgi:hypothetical protein
MALFAHVPMAISKTAKYPPYSNFYDDIWLHAYQQPITIARRPHSFASNILDHSRIRALSYSMAHLAVPYGGRQDARLEPKYIYKKTPLVSRCTHR